MKWPIGGFFEIEWPQRGDMPHTGCHALSTGRCCLSVILNQIRPTCVHVPFYTCNATLEPFKALKIPITFYAIDKNFFPTFLPELKNGEYFLWTNYFGLFAKNTKRILDYYGAEKVILDETHHFFEFERGESWAFTSARKYMGIPDGAFLHAPEFIEIELQPFNDPSLMHGVLRLMGNQSEAFKCFHSYEASLGGRPHRMSSISQGILRSLDIGEMKECRRLNFQKMHEYLGKYNILDLSGAKDTPFCYPILPIKSVNHTELHNAGFFVPHLWSDLLSRKNDGFEWELNLAKNLLPLPLDHRYKFNDLLPMVEMIIDRIERSVV